MKTIDYVFTENRQKLELTYLGHGGEGNVYEVVGHPNLVVKAYHESVLEEEGSCREDKIAAMIGFSKSFRFESAQLSKDIAWPFGAV